MKDVSPKKVFRKFFSYFPTPGFLDMPIMAVAFSDSFVRYVEIENNTSSKEVKSFGEIPLASGIIESGHINKQVELSSVLQEVRDKEKQHKFAKVSLPEEKGYLFASKIPKASLEGLSVAVESLIEENVPVNLQSVSYDFDILPFDDDQENILCAVSVVPNKVIDIYASTLDDIGLTPISFELESQALVRVAIPKENNGVVLVLYVTGNKVDLIIAYSGIAVFSSTSVLYSPSEGVAGEVYENTKKILLYWADHMIEDYMTNKLISNVYICGDSKDIDSIREHLKKQLNQEVHTVDVWANILSTETYVPPIEKKDSSKYALALGLALEETKNV